MPALDDQNFNIARCLICDGDTIARRAAISPFIVERCDFAIQATNIRLCASCEFAFFERRYTEREVARLYHDYRGKDYNAQRLRFEPHYSSHIATFADPYSSYYVRRIQDLSDVLDIFPEIKPNCVLDFGGDGSLAKRLFPKAEVSHIDTSAGVSLKHDRFDLIICSQVFEHLSEPRKSISEIIRYMHEDSLLILEVPRDFSGTLNEAFVLQARHGGPMNQMHEHINFFSPRATLRLIETQNLVSVFQVETPLSPNTITIAGYAEAPCVKQLNAVSAERKFQWSMDRIFDVQEADRNRLAAAMSGIHQNAKHLQEIYARLKELHLVKTTS